uniref:t-SNARE coiled-coil homology domain-containing protein n=1 Tax=Knipowitschia caucasica TaxID=637954 RepID=A0AAV2K211_KNICA
MVRAFLDDAGVISAPDCDRVRVERRNGRLVEAQVERAQEEGKGAERRRMSQRTLDPASLSHRIVDGTEDNTGTRAFSFSSAPSSTAPSSGPQVSTAELAAKAEETRGQLRSLGQQVSSLGKEVSDLGQLMSRMAQLMDSFMSSSHTPSLCPAHCCSLDRHSRPACHSPASSVLHHHHTLPHPTSLLQIRPLTDPAPLPHSLMPFSEASLWGSNRSATL